VVDSANKRRCIADMWQYLLNLVCAGTLADTSGMQAG
jgi:hypothetical protein